MRAFLSKRHELLELPNSSQSTQFCGSNIVESVPNFFSFLFLFLVPLNEGNFTEWKQKFYAEPKNVLAQNICSRNDPFEACISKKVIENTQHVFSHKV